MDPPEPAPFHAVVDSRDVGTPFLEAPETGSEPSPHGEFSLKVHPGDTIPQHPTCGFGGGRWAMPLTSMVLHCKEAVQGLALTCQVGIVLHSHEGQG